MNGRSLSGARILVCLVFALCQDRIAAAATGVPAWEQTYRKSLAGSGSQFPIAGRELADGSTMVVVLDNAGVSCVRYGSDGTPLSTSTFYPPWGATLAGIDPFGAVFLVAEADRASFQFTTRGDVWTMKYDGLSGRALWSAAQTYDSPDHRRDEPLRASVDPSGDILVLGVTHANAGFLTQFVLKYDGTTGSPSWAPILATTYFGTSAVDGVGDVYVSGNIPGQGNRSAKYSGTTGGLLWDSAGPVGIEPLAVRIAAGRFVVMGRAFGGPRSAVETEAYDATTGALLWTQLYGDPFGTMDQHPLALAVGDHGEVFVAGISGAAEYFTLKLLASSGAVAWGPILTPGDYLPGVAHLDVASDGDLLQSLVPFHTPDYAVTTWRYDAASGDVVWGPESAVGGCCGYGVPPFVSFLESNGRLFLTLPRSNGTDTETVSFARDPGTGQPAWPEQAFTGLAGGTGRLNDLTLDPAGDVLVTGNVSGGDGNTSWATIKYEHATGAVLWGPVFFDTNSPGGFWPYQVLTDAPGNAIVIGIGQFGEEYRLVVKKYAAANGSEMWTSGIISNFLPYGLAIDASGNPAILGQMLNTGKAGNDNALTKLSGATGLGLWGPILYDGAADDYPTSLAIDASGDLFVTGLAYGNEPFAYALKYSGGSGSLLWGPKTIDNARPNFVTVDSSGNAIVTGYQNTDMFTVKYGGVSGASLWGPILTPSSGGSSSGFWATTAPNGDAFVTGPFYENHAGVYDTDVAITKFRASDGAILWGPVLYDGTAHRNDYPYSVVLDAAGNPVVAGESEVERRSYRIAAMKYDGATGAPVWGPLLLGEAGRTDVNGLAVRDGSVYVGGIVGGTYRTIALVETLGIATAVGDVAPATCGLDYALAFLAQNGTPAYTWSVVSGALPPGMSLSWAGLLSGAPAADGVFSFRVRVQDSSAATVERDFTLTVGGPDSTTIVTATDDACQTTLSVPGSWSAYVWQPNGQTTPTIVVSPAEATTYGVLLTDSSGCTVQAAITIPGTVPGQSCLAPSIGTVVPNSGPASGGTPVAIAGANFQAGASVVIGDTAASGVSVIGPDTIAATTPALSAGAAYDVAVMNSDGRRAVLAGGWVADFLDVPASHPFHDFVVTVLRRGISAGCGGGNYCPDAAVTRAQMAVFLLKAEHGASYAPPSCTGLFGDVACPGGFAVDWIEQLASESVTAGCGGGNYCPDSAVTRAQMAVFLLKTLLGSAYAPPPATGVFVDVPVGSFAADWIEDLYGRAITGGCSASPLLYCPGNSNTRGQMAVFLVKTFGL